MAVVAGVSAAPVFGLLASDAAGAPSRDATATARTCRGTDLATLGGTQGNAAAVSGNGLVTGYATDAAGRPQPALWRGGRVARISTGLINVSPTGINSRGEVVGTGVKASGLEEVGWHWAAGRTTLLRTPAGKISVPAAISDTGRIVGALASDDDGGAEPTSGEAPEQAATWASFTAPARVLPSLAGDIGAHVYGVNKNGTMVGNSQGTDHFTPAMWNANGRVVALPGLGGKWGIARVIDDHGVVVGAAVAAGGEPQAMKWDVSHRGKKLDVAGGRKVQGIALARGLAVGQTDVSAGGDLVRTQAVRWDAGGAPTLISPSAGHTGAGVNAASASGLIVGFSSDARGVRKPTTWTCAP